MSRGLRANIYYYEEILKRRKYYHVGVYYHNFFSTKKPINYKGAVCTHYGKECPLIVDVPNALWMLYNIITSNPEISIITGRYYGTSTFFKENISSYSLHSKYEYRTDYPVLMQIEKLKTRPMNDASFSTAFEYHEFPMRNYFFQRHGKFPIEFITKFLRTEYVEELINGSEVISIQRGIYDKKDYLQYVALKFEEGSYGLFVYANGDHKSDLYCGILLYENETKSVKELIDHVRLNTVSPEKQPEEEVGYINVLIQSSRGFELKKKKIASPDIDFSLNYNDGFEETHNLIVERLNKSLSKGLVLLHGIAGSGKTTYIRYLINVLKKTVIYIPPNLVSHLSDPTFIDFLMDHDNSVLVIEDAENALISRKNNQSASVSNVLNLTDGLLSDCANIQIVATFNTDLKNIDEALLRKGRLITKYEFKKLTADRQKKLSAKLGVELEGEMTLADIYNSDEKSFVGDKQKIGYAI